MMIGTADEIVRAPEKSPVFVEDLPEEEQAAALVRMAFLLYAYI
jgi:ubiquitin carboxyl-terminal hydrolase 14